MNLSDLIETGVYLGFTAVFLVIGAYALLTVVGASLPSLNLGSVVIALIFIAAMLVVVLLGVVGSNSD